jgi:hypothetical protein
MHHRCAVALAAAITPVPVSEIVCGLLAALSEIETLALRAPAALGVKTRVIWQAVFAASELPQFWSKLKSSMLSPVTEMSKG